MIDQKGLEACRRCGQRDAEVFANDGWYTVECNNCPCRTSGADRTAEDAIAAWNRRATPSRNEVLEEAATVAEIMLRYADTTSEADIAIPAAIRALVKP